MHAYYYKILVSELNAKFILHGIAIYSSRFKYMTVEPSK